MVKNIPKVNVKTEKSPKKKYTIGDKRIAKNGTAMKYVKREIEIGDICCRKRIGDFFRAKYKTKLSKKVLTSICRYMSLWIIDQIKHSIYFMDGKKKKLMCKHYQSWRNMVADEREKTVNVAGSVNYSSWVKVKKKKKTKIEEKKKKENLVGETDSDSESVLPIKKNENDK